MKITKYLIAKNISRNTNFSGKESSEFVETFISIIKKNVEKKIIKISSFGTFQKKQSPKRIGRNPKTGESYIIPTMRKVIFITSNKIKKFLN